MTRFCKECGSKFHTYPAYIARGIRHGLYCSKVCRGKGEFENKPRNKFGFVKVNYEKN